MENLKNLCKVDPLWPEGFSPGIDHALELEKAQEQIKELKTQVESLKSQLRNANNTLEQYRNYSRKNYQNDYDYVPYHEDDHGRE